MTVAGQEEIQLSWETYQAYHHKLQEDEKLFVSPQSVTVTQKRSSLERVLAFNLPFTILWSRYFQMFVQFNLEGRLLHSFVLKVSGESKCELE